MAGPGSEIGLGALKGDPTALGRGIVLLIALVPQHRSESKTEDEEEEDDDPGAGIITAARRGDPVATRPTASGGS